MDQLGKNSSFLKDKQIILVTGISGQLGHHVFRLLSPEYKTFGTLQSEEAREFKDYDQNIKNLDLKDTPALLKVLDEVQPNFIINCAAYTAVDKAEIDQDLSMILNRDVPKVLATESARRDITLIHISTDYVFNGKGDHFRTEDEPTDPVNFYGRSKEQGEQEVLQSAARGIILRTSWVFSERGQNFVKTMLRLAKTHDPLKIVNDQIGSPTSALELAQAIYKIVNILSPLRSEEIKKFSGIYHTTCQGITHWAAFAEKIFEFGLQKGILEKKPRIKAIPTSEYPLPAKRPLNSRLNGEKLKKTFDIQLNHWEQALEDVIERV